MSFHSWLQYLRSALAPGRGQRHRGRRGPLRAATHRPNLEVLEDRCLLSFSGPESFPAGTSPLDVATADFNKDGNLDLATASYGGAVSVLLGDGQGGFGEATDFAAGASPRSVAVADFNNDDQLDLATVHYGDDDVSVLLGNGDGTFRPPVNTAVLPDPGAVAVADFNADGKMDLVYTSQGYVEVLLGDGGGGFAGRHGCAVLDSGSGLAVADLNADGKPDVVTVNGGFYVGVLLGNGDGTLTYKGRFAAGTYATAVTVGDFTGDGIPDLATTGLSAGWVDVLPGRGDGTFSTPIYNDGELGTSIAAADFNGDGKLDVVTAYGGTDGEWVSLLLGQGNGTFAPPEYNWAGYTITALAVGEFNGDGRPDVAAADAGMNAVSVLLNDGDWTPRISISDVTRAEGKKGKTTLFTFTVTLSAPSAQPVTMSYRTMNGTATTSDGDYVGKTGTLTFAPGETTKTITIDVKGDSKKEANETFYLDLFGNSGNSLFTKNRGLGTILNDD